MIKYFIKQTNRCLTSNCLPFFIEFHQSCGDGACYMAWAGKNGYVFKNPMGFKSDVDAKKWIKRNFDPKNLIISQNS